MSAEGTSQGAQEQAPNGQEVCIWPGGLGEGCMLPNWVRAEPRIKNASGEFCRRFFSVSKSWYMVWSLDSRLNTNVEGHEVKGQGHVI